MPRSLSSALVASKNAVESTNPWRFLFELTITGAPAPLRFVNDVQALTFDGDTYLPFPVRIDGVEESSEGVLQNLKVTAANVDQQIGALLETYWSAVTDPIWTVNLWYVDVTQPDETPVTSKERFIVDKIDTDWLAATFTLTAEGLTLTQTLPRRRFTRLDGFPNIPRVR